MSKFRSEKQLHQAILDDNASVAERLMMQGADINEADADGFTPLHYAVIMQNTNIIHMLLTRGADINKADTDGDLPLHHAIYIGRTDIVILLIEKDLSKSSVNSPNIHGQTPLHLAVYNGFFTMTVKLIKSGANVNASDIGDRTPLHWAAEQYNTKKNYIFNDIINILLDNGADILKEDNKGYNPLEILDQWPDNKLFIQDLMQRIPAPGPTLTVGDNLTNTFNQHVSNLNSKQNQNQKNLCERAIEYICTTITDLRLFP